jgi:hypothetical protein
MNGCRVSFVGHANAAAEPNAGGIKRETHKLLHTSLGMIGRV